jgi:hypothetical protein
MTGVRLPKRRFPSVVYDEMMPVLMQGGNMLFLPMTSGWTSAVVNTGVASQHTDGNYVATGAGANSSARLYTSCSKGFTTHEAGDMYYFNWTRKLHFIFSIGRNDSDTEVVARVQLKNSTAEGALADDGLGIRIDNYDVYGESYEAALGIVNLGTTLTNRDTYQVEIIHYPGQRIEWWIEGTLRGVQTTVNTIPSSPGSKYATLVHSIINGATGGVNAVLYLMQPRLWQRRY